MNPLKIGTLCLLALLLTTVSCSSTAVEPEATPTPIIQISAESTSVIATAAEATSTNSPLDTKTPLPNTPEPVLPSAVPSHTPTETSSPIRQPVLCNKSQLSNINPNSGEGIEGVLGLVIRPDSTDVNPSHEAYASLIGGKPIQEQIFQSSTQNIRELGFSPNQDWFAYQAWSDEGDSQIPEPRTYLISIEGETLSTIIPFEEGETDGFWTGNWIDNDLMLLIYDLPSEAEAASPYAYTIFNPFTGERQQTILDSLQGWNPNTTPYFSPDMTRVVFMRSGLQGNTMVLWDLIEGKELWQQPFVSDVHLYEGGIGLMNGFGQTVMWAHDSSRFVFSSWNQNQYVSSMIDRNGERQRILLHTSDPQDGVIYEGAWSPDNRYIAYVNEHFDTDKQEWLKSIMIYDFELSEVVEICSELKWIDGILWSPNSEFLAFTSQIEDHLELITLNIYTGEVTSLGEVQNFLAASWLENESWLNVD